MSLASCITFYTNIPYSKLKDKFKDLIGPALFYNTEWQIKICEDMYKFLFLLRDKSSLVKKTYSDSNKNFSDSDIIPSRLKS